MYQKDVYIPLLLLFFVVVVARKDLPSSFVGENFQADTDSQQQQQQQPSPKAEKDAITKDIHSNATKSSIDNTPIYMIYANSNASVDVKKDVETMVEEKGDSLWRLPNKSGVGLLWWALIWPIKLVLTITIPNPKTFRKLYPLTFLMCIIWIGMNAYLIVWMVTIIGMLSAVFISPPKIAIHFHFHFHLHTTTKKKRKPNLLFSLLCILVQVSRSKSPML